MACQPFNIFISGKSYLVSRALDTEALIQKYVQENGLGEAGDFYLLCGRRRVASGTLVQADTAYQLLPRLPGGKGGFGSMLRAIGAQIEKTTSREACRDLSGRRMRDINNEKKLKEWLSKEAEREQTREERRAERRARQLNAQHKFEDQEYSQAKARQAESLEDALRTGLKRNTAKDSAGPPKKKAATDDMLGMDIDSDDLTSDSDGEVSSPCCPKAVPEAESGPAASPSVTETVDSTFLDKPNKQTSDKLHSDIVKDSSEMCNLSETDKVNSQNGEKVVEEITPVEPVKVAEPQVDPQTPVDLEDFSDVEDLEALGLDRLKHALMARGMKCGGTLAERATRLMCVKGLNLEDIDPALLAKGKGKGKKTK